MLAEVKFKDGSICMLKKIYNWEGMYIYDTGTCYLLVPYKDVISSKVSVEEYTRKDEPVKAKVDTWKEIELT